MASRPLGQPLSAVVLLAPIFLAGLNLVALRQRLVGNFSDCQIFIGDEYRIDVSSEAGNRFDQNITGFRAEEEFGFNAEP